MSRHLAANISKGPTIRPLRELCNITVLDGYNHIWPLPARPRYSLELCLVPKCGSTEMRKLMGFAQTDHFPVIGRPTFTTHVMWHAVERWKEMGVHLTVRNGSSKRGRPVMLEYEYEYCRASLLYVAPDVTVLAFLLVRNPYERLLSSYLSMVARDTVQEGWEKSVELYFGPGNRSNSSYGAFAANAAGFAEFVRKLTAFRIGSLAFGNIIAMAHLAPITSVGADGATVTRCLEPAYRKGADLRAHYHVLKLEQQAQWWPAWVQATGLSKWTQDSRWPGQCFWKADGSSCRGSIDSTLPGLNRGAERTCRQRRLTHDSGSCTRLHAYYTEDVAARVTAWYAEDLRVFSYPTWAADGDTGPLAGPLLWPPPSERARGTGSAR